MNAEWKKALAAEMRKTRARLIRTGCVGMSRNNFWQVVRIPLNGGPVGTNCATAAREVFDLIIDNDRFLRSFTNIVRG